METLVINTRENYASTATRHGCDRAIVSAAVDAASLAIPPVWPLASSVAVNPYLGQTHQNLSEVAARLARVVGAPVTMSRDWYWGRIASASISDTDLADALATADADRRPASLAALKTAAAQPAPTRAPLPTIADLAADVSGIDWPGLIADRLGGWAASYFDQGQALWAAPQPPSAYTAWRAVATHDLTPEIFGLRRFAAFAAAAPDAAIAAIARSVATLSLLPDALETYFHALLTTLGGWAQVARYQLWQAQLAGHDDETLTDLLAIRLLWEEALFARYGGEIGARWAETVTAHAQPVRADADQIVDTILQEASERASQRALAAELAQPATRSETTTLLQAAFCIDVRSEVFRRALETAHPAIWTLGFAGFFGLTTSHRRFASDVAEHRLPVLLNPGLSSRSGEASDTTADQTARFGARASRAWGRFKFAAVSSFAFVEAMGPVYVARLVRDALGVSGNAISHEPPPRIEPALDIAAQVASAETILRAMSLTANFAPLVLLVGHGANVVNNPHASALACGACGGYSGEVNARLLARLLNAPDVRAGLRDVGIAIGDETLFVAGLHDTTTDGVMLYADDHPAPAHREAIEQARQWLETAGLLARGERALRLPRAQPASVAARSRNWAETRPEWGLAGCRAFVAAPRARTAGRNLAGRVFLHDYDWHHDKGFAVLELILTAPVVVASWISLQYYGSTVDPVTFGGGNKLLHNIVGGIGVVEGNGGTLRAGLPWQSVHDGRALAHDPLRLSVCVEAPTAAIVAILVRHADVRALFDNRWLHLFALDDKGAMAWRYDGNLGWEAVDGPR